MSDISFSHIFCVCQNGKKFAAWRSNGINGELAVYVWTFKPTQNIFTKDSDRSDQASVERSLTELDSKRKKYIDNGFNLIIITFKSSFIFFIQIVCARSVGVFNFS